MRGLGAIGIAVLALAATATRAQEATRFDSAGVVLGSGVAEAMAALTRAGFRAEQTSRTFDLAPDLPFVQAIEAHKEDDVSRETIVVRFEEPPSAPRAFLIWRSIAYKPGKAPVLASYRAAVREKAGHETYWRDAGGGLVEHYVQWSRTGGKRGGLFNALDSLPSSYPNPCVVGIGVRSSQEALAAVVRAPDYGRIGGGGPPALPGIVVPQARCASGLLIDYRVPDRATGLVQNVNMLLIDQAAAEAMVTKRNALLAARRADKVEAAKAGGGRPIL